MRTLSRGLVIMIGILVLVGVGLGLVFAARQSGSASQPPPPAPDPQTAAEQALDTFRQMVTDENYQALGFQTPNEIKTARLGQPLTILRVPLDRLLSFSPENNPEELLVDENRVIYPVTANEQVRSSITVEGAEQGWNAMEFGNSTLIKALVGVRQEPSDFIVQVPALSLYLIAQRSDNELLLTPILDDPRFGFNAGETLTAAAAFEAMLPVAREYNGLPDG